jgi:hypothetical protein
MIAALRPDLSTPARPADPNSWDALYIRAFLWLRTLVGALGIALPVVVILVDKFVFEESPFPRGSVSVYYYSGVRDLFVAILSATGVFFIAYKVSEKTLENTLSLAAGALALLIPLFPTLRPSKDIPLTPLQKLLGDHTVWVVHFVASAGFLLSLMGISFMFGWRERGRERRQGQRFSPTFWSRYHFICAAAMALALIWIIATLSAHWPPDALLAGEWVTAWAFGASWLMKGLELDTLRKKPRGPVGAGAAVRAA